MDQNPYAPPQSGTAIAPEVAIDKRQRLLGKVALLLAIFASVWLLIGAAHVRSDRTKRRPVVTSVGPLSGHVTQITYSGLGLSLIAMIIASVAMRDDKRFLAPATFAAGIAAANFYLTFVIYCGIYEH
jgi:hypothetical protein